MISLEMVAQAGIWEDFKRFLSEHQNLVNNEEELSYYWSMADKYLKELRNN